MAENPNVSKEAVNRRGVELLLRVFGWRSKQMVCGGVGVGVLCSEMISNIEQQGYANISTKILVKSLVVQWKQLCSGCNKPVI